MLTTDEICDKLLVLYDVEDLIELLQITATELLERFDDKIELYYDRLHAEVSDGEGA